MKAPFVGHLGGRASDVLGNPVMDWRFGVQPGSRVGVRSGDTKRVSDQYHYRLPWSASALLVLGRSGPRVRRISGGTYSNIHLFVRLIDGVDESRALGLKGGRTQG